MCTYLFTNLKLKPCLSVGDTLHSIYFVPQILLVFLLLFNFSPAQSQHSFVVHINENTITANFFEDLYLTDFKTLAGIYVASCTKLNFTEDLQITNTRKSLDRDRSVPRNLKCKIESFKSKFYRLLTHNKLST